MMKACSKTALALAVAGVCALTVPSALAATVSVYGSPTQPWAYYVADVDVLPANPVGIYAAFQVNIEPSDQIIGRTTGFSLKVTLPQGVKFGNLGSGSTFFGGSALPAGWTVALASGTGNGSNVAVFTFSPGAGSTGIVAGPLFYAGGFTLTGVTGSVNAALNFFDPVTTNDILNPMSFTLVTVSDPLQYSIHIANPNQRIDVGSDNGPSRTLFAPNGPVNSNNDTTSFNAGTVQIVNVPVPPPDSYYPFFVSSAPFVFQWAAPPSPGDTLDLALAGNFTTFAATGGAIYLGAPGPCATTVPAGASTATINAAGTSADFGALPYNSVNNQNICFIAPGGTTTINPTTIVANVTATRTWTGKSDSASANALAMQYNGPVQTVFAFNPATNSNQQSFLRISNTSAAAGLITLTAVDDSGHKAGPVTFTLGASQSIQLSSSDLENGNAAKGLTGSLGAGTGKWIVTVVGQVGSMEVTNLNRNNSSGTLNNLGRPVTGHGMEQPTQDVIPKGH
ncbi:MAG: hypothetical protein OJF55_001905 [Rhodanobacteraceae bacterium]|nr:MAG: hypothetical protein OJF55_001905 [Rhodanobacteraceae bacterium]